MTLRDAFAEAYEYAIGFTGRCTAPEVVDRAMHEHPELFWRHGERLIRRAALREARSFMKDVEPREEVSKTNQLEFPLGTLPGMPTTRTLVIQLPEGEYQHVRYDIALWHDLEAALVEKTLNIERAIARRVDHRQKMDALAPYMQHQPERTVGEACELMRKGPAE